MGDARIAYELGTLLIGLVQRKGETLVRDVLSHFLCNGIRIAQTGEEGNKKRRIRRREVIDDKGYQRKESGAELSSAVRIKRRRTVVGSEDKAALNNIGDTN